MQFLPSDFHDVVGGMSPNVTTLYYRFLDDAKKPFFLILPGGGYCHLSGEKEGSTVAKWAEARGFHAGVFAYQLQPVNYRLLLKEIETVLHFLRQQPQVGQIFVVGFSAGAHLAGLFATNGGLRPDGLVMCYPVVTFEKECRHARSVPNFFGGAYSAQQAHDFSLENRIDASVPPAFIWHTVEDQSVPCQNSLLLAQAYKKSGVPFELHLFPEGAHGLGTKNGTAHTRQWLTLLENWLDLQKGEQA